MSSKDKDNINSKQLYNEDLTKRLVKNILDNNRENEHTEKVNNNSDFNIEYEEYDNEQFENDDEYYDQEDEYDDEYYEDEEYDDEEYNDYKKYNHKIQKKSSSNIKEHPKKRTSPQNNNNYRRNIEKYGKEFFDDDYDEYDDNSPSVIGRVISFSIIIVLTISTAFLALNLISTKKELEQAKSKMQELLDNKEAEENKIMEDSLKSEIDSLKQENEELKAQMSTDKQPNQNDATTQQTTKPSTNSNAPANNNSNSSQSSEYIVKEGDVIWNISKKVYGNGSHFQKILDANGLKENSVLKPGQKLIIPKI